MNIKFQDLILIDRIFDNNEMQILKTLCKDNSWIRRDDNVLLEYDNHTIGNRYLKQIVQNIEGISIDKIINSYLNYLPYRESDNLKSKFKKGYTPDSKISKYIEGDDFYWHDDGTKKFEDNVIWTRNISSITYLNDDYEGGETEFSCGLIVKPEVGKTVVFPSNWCYPHQGRKIIKGIKYLYVLHIWT